MLRARRVVACFAVILIGLAIATPTRDPRLPTQLSPLTGQGSRTAVVVGDSISVLAADEFHTLTDAVLRTSYNAMSGTHMAAWVDLLPGAAALHPAAVVLALGTNDAAGWAAWAGYDPVPYWAQALDDLAGSCVVVVRPRDYDSAHTASQLWARLLPVLAAHPNVRVFDGWWQQTAQHPWLIGADGIHPTAYGSLAYAWTLFLAQHQCPA